jgi:DNA-binding CsgD family transcriptional regulator
MVGREVELEAGRRFLDALERGSACLVFEGEAGIGKTTVWRETVALAEQRGHRVLACRPAAAEAKLSYSGLAELLAGVEANLIERLPAPQRRALEIALLQAAPDPRAPEPRALFTAFSSTLSLLTEGQSVVVAIDDLQWLDRASQAAVGFVMRRLGDRPVGFLMSLRIGVNSVPPADLAHALRDAQPERVALGPLSLAALHALISEHLDHPLPRPILVRIAAAARGNPFYALEIARDLARRGDLAPGDALPVPEDLQELVSVRIKRLPSETQDSLLAAAALRDPALDLLDRAALEPAQEAGLVQLSRQHVVFAHPLFAAAVYASAGRARRHEMHRRLAGTLTDPEERARHLAMAATGPSDEIAMALELAADQARRRGAPEGAAELLEHAIRLTPPGQQDAGRSRTIAAAENHFHAGDLTRARTLAELALAGSPLGPVRGHALRVLGEVRYHLDSFTEAIPLFEQALAELEGDQRKVEVRVDLTFAHITHGSLQAAADHAVAAVDEIGEAGDRGMYALALGAWAIADFFLGRQLDLDRVELALTHEDPHSQTSMSIRPSLVAGIVLSHSDDFDRALQILSGLRQRTIDQGEESDLPMLCAQLSYVERQRGNLVAALGFADEGYRIAHTLGSQTSQAFILAERCLGRAMLGDVRGAREDADDAQRFLEQVDYRLAYFWRLWALAFLEVSLGNPAAAVALLEPLVAAVERRGHFYPQVALTLPDTLEALVAVGQVERAAALARLLQEYGREHHLASAVGKAQRCLALALAAQGDLSAAETTAEGAVLDHQRAGIPLEVGRSLLVKGQIERRAKRRGAARDSFEQALHEFERIGARLWADRARAELARTRARRAGSGDLTSTEQRVAQLATQGLTAKQIGEAIFLSPKTVEANLTRIYSKLGIRSRAELGRVMAERGGVAI